MFTLLCFYQTYCNLVGCYCHVTGGGWRCFKM